MIYGSSAVLGKRTSLKQPSSYCSTCPGGWRLYKRFPTTFSSYFMILRGWLYSVVIEIYLLVQVSMCSLREKGKYSLYIERPSKYALFTDAFQRVVWYRFHSLYLILKVVTNVYINRLTHLFFMNFIRTIGESD